jgi:hypothetical protein
MEEIIKIHELEKCGITKEWIHNEGFDVLDSYKEDYATDILRYWILYSKIVIYLHDYGCPDNISTLRLIKVDDTYYCNMNSVGIINEKHIFISLYIGSRFSLGFLKDNNLYLSSFGLECILNHSEFKKEKSKKTFDTYLMTDNSGLIKIGKSFDVTKRLKDFNNSNSTISLIAYLKRDIESELHSRFRIFNVKGEWFNLSSDQMLDLISEYNFTFYAKRR